MTVPSKPTKQNDASRARARGMPPEAAAANPQAIIRQRRAELRESMKVSVPHCLTVLRKAVGELPLADNERPPTDTQVATAKYILAQVLPPLRPVAPMSKFKLAAGSDVLTICQDLVIATSRGKLDPATCKELISALTKTYQVTEVEDVRKEIAELRAQFREQGQ